MSAPAPRSLGTRAGFVLATWFGCGLVPRAPGTVGTLGALPLYYLVAGGGPIAVLATALVVTALGVWSSARVVQALDTKDPQIVCIDEVAGVLIALAAAPHTWQGVFAAVLLFRALDVWKPFPARQLESLPGGWGVMMDDVAAGVWAAFALLAARSGDLL